MKRYVLICLGLIVIQVLVLLYQGHIFICKCGYVQFWHGAINSSEDSQHMTDWYTLSHIIHGILFYWFLRWVTRKRLSVGACLAIAVGIEVGWEILENSPIIINRYREATASLAYFGDSILNSVCDVLAMAFGFLIARKSPVWLSVALVIGMEALAGYVIHDNLTLNVIMLVHPVEAIKQWQLLK